MLPRASLSSVRDIVLSVLESPAEKGGNGFENTEEGQFALGTLLYEGVLNSYFPVHSPARELLVDGWASWEPLSCQNLMADIYTTVTCGDASFKLTAQPLDTVRDYLGEQIAMYFRFLGLYTEWLGGPALFGFILWLIGMISQNHDHEVS